MYEPEHFEIDIKRVDCPGCPATMEPGDLCCDLCWRRVPLLLRAGLRVPRMKKYGAKFLAAEDKVAVWLTEHKVAT